MNCSLVLGPPPGCSPAFSHPVTPHSRAEAMRARLTSERSVSPPEDSASCYAGLTAALPIPIAALFSFFLSRQKAAWPVPHPGFSSNEPAEGSKSTGRLHDCKAQPKLRKRRGGVKRKRGKKKASREADLFFSSFSLLFPPPFQLLLLLLQPLCGTPFSQPQSLQGRGPWERASKME